MHVESAYKTPVLIASSLKPIQDTRAFAKLGLSLRETNKYRLNFIGFSSKRPLKSSDVRYFYSISDIKSFWQRAFLPIRFLYLTIKTRPKVLICCTWEYLLPATLLKFFLRYSLIYDVQENYIANQNLPNSRSSLAKSLSKTVILLSERLASIDHYLLAESCYAVEMPEKKPALLLPNLFQGKIRKTKPFKVKESQKIHLLVTGTLSPAFGTLDALKWVDILIQDFPQIKLHVIGHYTIEKFGEELTDFVKNKSYINLEISRQPIAHEQIIEAMEMADFVLLPYKQSPEIAPKMPTKLYECAGLGKAVLHSPNPNWENFLSQFGGGKSIDFLDLINAKSSFKLALSNYYFQGEIPSEIHWDTVKPDFQRLIQSLS